MGEAFHLESERRTVPILANPRSGSGKSRRIVDALVNALRTLGYEPRLSWEREELAEILASAAREDVRCVVAAGGDGTLLEVVNRAVGVPVAVLPLGNENLVARHCGISRSGRFVADAIHAGCARRFDLARANGRLYCLMASVGIDADVVHRVHRRRRGHINRFHYALPLLQALRRYRFPAIDVVIEETGERLRGTTVFLFNFPEYALGLPIAGGGSAQDGLLDLCVFEKAGLPALARYFAAVLARRHHQLPDFQHRRVRRVYLSSEEPTPVQTDGDPAGRLPVQIEIVPRALPLVVGGERQLLA